MDRACYLQVHARSPTTISQAAPRVFAPLDKMRHAERINVGLWRHAAPVPVVLGATRFPRRALPGGSYSRRLMTPTFIDIAALEQIPPGTQGPFVVGDY